jgi:hypothetical protein
MPLPAPNKPPTCPICGGSLADGPTIPMTSGGAVHIRCAEAQARTAARTRAVRAAVSALVAVGGWGLAMEGGAMRATGGDLIAVLLAMVLIAFHILVNRRWWSYTIQRAQLWWRMGRYQ